MNNGNVAAEREGGHASALAGAGERAVKYNATTGEETLYFNRMWQIRNGEAEWVQSKHIYVGETRIGTKYNSEGNENTGAERERIYYYHGDHLGSAQVVTNHEGQLYERLEYTPYGETWIEWKNPGLRLEEAAMPYRFTGKEQDAETGLYYYGARYLDPKTSRWLSADPAMGDYLPGAPVDDAARRRNGALPGQGGVFNLVNLHVYHYAGNNPVKYTDPDGEDIELYGTPEEQTKLLNLINEYSFKQYDIDSNGKLYATDKTNSGQSSREYSRYLDAGIQNQESTSVVFLAEEGGYINDRGERINLNETGGGRTDYLVDRRTGEIYRQRISTGVTGKSGYASGLGEVPAAGVLMHELITHSIPLGLGGRDRENSIRIENKARVELGLPLRPADPNHTVREY